MAKSNPRVSEFGYRGSAAFKDYTGPIDSVQIISLAGAVLAPLSATDKALAKPQGFIIQVNGRYDNPGRFAAIEDIKAAVGRHEKEGIRFVSGRDRSYGYVIGDLKTAVSALQESGKFSGTIIDLLNKELEMLSAERASPQP